MQVRSKETEPVHIQKKTGEHKDGVKRKRKKGESLHEQHKKITNNN